MFVTTFGHVDDLWFIVKNVWDEVPAGDIKFQSELRSAARSMMRSNNTRDIIDQYALVNFITRGIQLNSIRYFYSPTDQRNSLSCNCLAKLLIEVICEGHSKEHYQDNILLHIGETFVIDCFKRYFDERSEEQLGVFFNHSSLLPILDHQSYNPAWMMIVLSITS